ncbi:ABC transporter ATP-binding protein [Methylomonas sp. MK1]|uniref:ABC transporter ATP-binding protein n=1 Tax=Methylomonas sp. MK1 TaxID=1131552 RepID=UPI000381040A|nr:ABC transporter ATP-binding protein [Methylomonas sp. MK1]
MTPAIKVENLGKKYTIKHESQTRYSTLRDQLSGGVRSMYHRLRHPLQAVQCSQETEQFWALRDINFEIHPGDRVGIIGRNGAGKSTLLKILSRITAPTTGKVTINGRVASLLEIGTGFHPELSGRENIFLNGAVLGMRKYEIQKKFDEIVDFAEVKKFLDTPVKHYSSGMYVRLAFAVAAHLEPEILIVDEVLAVGDTQFQKKCLGKMGEVAKDGKTIIFVSHSMGMITELCSSTILLGKGSILNSGTTQDVIKHYLENAALESNKGYIATNKYSNDIYFEKIQATNSQGMPTTNFLHNESIKIALRCVINRWVTESVIGFYLIDQRGRKVFTNNNNKWPATGNDGDVVNMAITIPKNFLVPGQYYCTFAISVHHVRAIDIAQDAILINVIDAGTVFASYEGFDYGCVFADCQWELD